MATEPLLSIGAFARAVGLAPSALRYYDDAGLLTPAEVDARTGYRYYTPDLERRAFVIRRLREVDVPVETMRLVLDGDQDKARAALREITERADDSARRTAAAVAAVLPALAPADPTAQATVAGPELAAALGQVARAACTDEGSPLAGVLLEIGERDVAVVATDRAWLARWSVTGEAHRGAARGVVPLAAVDDLARWLVARRTVTVTVTADTLVCTADQRHEVALLADRFPAWRLVFADQPDPVGRAVLAREPLLRALSGAVADFAVGADRVTVSEGAEGVRLSAVTSGERTRFGLPVRLLGTVLGAMCGPQVSFDYAAPDRAVQVGSPGQPQLRALLMPT